MRRVSVGLSVPFIAWALLAQVSDAANLRAAGQATQARTQRFPIEPARWTEARAFVGKYCAPHGLPVSQMFSGFRQPAGFETVVLKGGFVTPKEKGGARVAFLVQIADDGSCHVRDVVALPDAGHANAFLQCFTEDLAIEGFGMRVAGRKELVGFWTVENGHFNRQSATAPGSVLHCQEPESGE